MEWITPKTDWDGDAVNPTDYNRIKNNLLYLHNKINEHFPPDKPLPDLGVDKAYGDYYYASEFNAFEDELEDLNKRAYNYDIGKKQIFVSLGKFITSNELNRIESATLKLYQMIEQIEGKSVRTAFKASKDYFPNKIRNRS